MSHFNAPSLSEGDYVTDQHGLYRVVHVLRRRAAVLEDCRTLELVWVAARDLSRVKLQLVRAAGAA